jgi:hypothetical protein
MRSLSISFPLEQLLPQARSDLQQTTIFRGPLALTDGQDFLPGSHLS